MTDAQVDISALVDQIFRESENRHAQYVEEQHRLILAEAEAAERMWGGEHVVDLDLPRFDHIDSIQLSITSDQMECDHWLKVYPFISLPCTIINSDKSDLYSCYPNT